MSLSGFTLFKVPRGWQLSMRQEGTDGWQVIADFPEDKARRLLSEISSLVSEVPKPRTEPVRGRLDLRPASSSRVRL